MPPLSFCSKNIRPSFLACRVDGVRLYASAPHTHPPKPSRKPRLRRRVDVCGSGNSLRCSRLCRAARSRLLVCYRASWFWPLHRPSAATAHAALDETAGTRHNPAKAPIYTPSLRPQCSEPPLRPPQLPSLLAAARQHHKSPQPPLAPRPLGRGAATAIRHRRDTKRCRPSRT